jgi:F-type H+-transporting ATPase subunit a
MTFLTVAIVFALIYWASRDLQLKPKGKQNVLEWFVDFAGNVVKDNLPEKEVRNFQFITFSLFSFLLVANNIGLVTKIVVGNETNLWKSPTADPVITLTLALIVVLMASFMGVKRFGFKAYVANYGKPMKFLAVMNILEEFTNLLTLGLRLYGNIYAGELLLSLIASVGNSHGILTLPLAIPLEILWTAFSVFISCIQAFIFVTLMNVYMSHKIVEEH